MANYTKQKARKDYPDEGIKKGEEYYKWSFRFGGEYRSKTPPARAQLTQSDYFGAVYSLFDGSAPESPEDLESMADDLAQIGEEQQEKYDNMPDGLQQGDTGQLLEERANACEEKAQELRDLAEEWKAAQEDHEQEMKEYAEAMAEYRDVLAAYEKEHAVWSADPSAYKDSGAGNDGEEPEEPDEPDEPDEFDAQEFIRKWSARRW